MLKYYVMKKILIVSFVAISLAACSNPEDSVNNNTDSARNANTEDSTLNTQPGPTTPDTSGGSRADTSMVPAGQGNKTSSSAGGTPGGN